MSKIISLSNLKGGTGKTTSTINLTAYLARQKKKVLAIDLDPQCSLSKNFGVYTSENNSYTVLGHNDLIENGIIDLPGGYSLLPSSLELSKCEVALAVNMDNDLLLKSIHKIKRKFDFIIIDSPPGMGALVTNSLFSSDIILIPIEPEPMSVEGMKLIKERISWIEEKFRTKPQIIKTFFVKLEENRKLTKGIKKSVQTHYKESLLKSVIRKNVLLAEAYLRKTDIFQYDPGCNGSKDYENLGKEVLKL